MKYNSSLLVALMLSAVVFGQKKELKVAEKSFKKKQYNQALTDLKSVAPLLEQADDKLKEKYYYIKAKSLYGDGKNRENDMAAGTAFQELIQFENKAGLKKYKAEAQSLLNFIVQDILNAGSKSYENKEYKNASSEFEMVYNLSKKDTFALEYAALSAYQAKNYDGALELFQSLLKMGYTGISTQYIGISNANGEEMRFATQKELDRQVNLKIVKDPEVRVTPSKTGDIAKNIALCYIAKDEKEKALDAITEAKKMYPNDYMLVISEANIYYQLGDNDKFLSGLREAISIKPDDPQLYYNVGVISLEQGYAKEAIEAFKKAIELKPNYADAYNNIGVAILKKEEPIIDEMNNTNDFKKYDQLNAKRTVIYKEALPYFEKVVEINPANKEGYKILASIYEVLGMYDKQKEAKAKSE